MYKLNCVKKSVIQSDDLHFHQAKDAFKALASANLNEEYIIKENYKIYDQGKIGSCVANSIVGILEILLAAQGINTELSRLFVYYCARAKFGIIDDNGSYIRDAFESLKKLGVCLESEWEYDESKVLVTPHLRCFASANDNKISDFYVISAQDPVDKLEQIELAIRSNHPVTIGIAVEKAFTDYIFPTKNKIWDIPQNPIGNHAMCLVGVRTLPDYSKIFLARNSWSEDFGDREYPGHCWLTEGYVLEAEDLYVATKIPNLVF